MGTNAQRIKRIAYHNGAFHSRLAIQNEAGGYLTTSDITSASYTLLISVPFKVNEWQVMTYNNADVHSNVSINIADAVLNTPGSCTGDSGAEESYNFVYTFPTSGAPLFPERNRSYLLRFDFELSDGNITCSPEIEIKVN